MVERLNVRLIVVFAHAHMILAQGGYLGCVGNANDLGVFSELSQDATNGICRGSAYAYIGLVQH